MQSAVARKIITLPLMAAILLFFGGCVPQDRYDQLLTAHRSLEEQLTKSESDREAERANLETVRRQLSRANANLSDLQSQNEQLNSELAKMGGDYDSLLRRVSDLEIGPLPAEVESAIQELAAAYPDVLSFDSRRGLLRLASDFTFDLGSVSLRSDAERTLRELAKILNTPEARNFEARIVGHTDNVPIGRPETRRNHPTNMHLSVHRAISVRDTLATAGVSSERMQVAGYGPYRPQVANRTGGTAENRRVEIFLVPMPADIIPTDEPSEEPVRAERRTETRTQAAPDDPMK